MASAISLNATATILGGAGLSANVDMVSAISTFKNLGTVSTVANIFITANTVAANTKAAINSSLGNLGSGVYRGHWLIDYWPSNITPTCSGTVTTYGNTSATSSFINTLATQVNLPFSNGMSGFASVYQKSSGFAMQSFDAVSSVSILKGKTYADSGVGYNGIHDLVTVGLGVETALLADVVKDWGTMYDVTNLNLFADPYVFGQNLLNQGLGSYGNLAVKFKNVGLDITDITKIPATVTTVTQVQDSLTTNTVVGEVELPILTPVSSTNVVTGNSVDVIMSIYRSVTGSDLAEIVSATGIVTDGTSVLTTLEDYLNFYKVIGLSYRPKLLALNIRSLTDLGTYLHSKIGQARFASWKEIPAFLRSIEIPTLNYTSTDSSAKILDDSTITTINNLASGSGPFGNPIMSDFLGATAGVNYISNFKILNSSYAELYYGVYSALRTLDSALVSWKNAYIAEPEYIPPTTAVDSAVAAVNSALNSLPYTEKFYQSESAYISMLTQLSTEVTNLSKAGVEFTSGYTSQLSSFAQQFSSLAGDKDQSQSYQLLSSLITHDASGDKLRAAFAEYNNVNKLASVGILAHNDPQPSTVITRAAEQNMSITAYLSQNK